MLHLLLAAALTVAAAKPLFVPPLGFNHLDRDPAISSRLERSGGHFIAEYRLHARQSWGSVLLARSIVITIATHNSYGLSSEGYADTRVQMMQTVRGLKILRSKRVLLCGGRPAWRIDVAPPQGDELVDELYAASGDTVYVATLTYPREVGDRGAVHALGTLCPPGSYAAAAAPDQARSLPFALPAGWTAAGLPRTSEPFSGVGRWLHPSAKSHFLEAIEVVKAPADLAGSPSETSQNIVDFQRQNLPDYEQKASRPQRFCGRMDGWYSAYTFGQVPHAQSVEEVFAFGSDTLYVASYYRLAGDPEDPRARRAIESLCPPNSSTPEPAPAPTLVPSPVTSPPAPASSARPRRSRR